MSSVWGVTPKLCHDERGSSRLRAASKARSAGSSASPADVAPEDTNFVAKSKQLELLGGVRATEKRHQSKHISKSHVDEGPQPADSRAESLRRICRTVADRVLVRVVPPAHGHDRVLG